MKINKQKTKRGIINETPMIESMEKSQEENSSWFTFAVTLNAAAAFVLSKGLSSRAISAGFSPHRVARSFDL